MKHGILITAHANAEVNKALMRILDDCRFKFYLLIDKKADVDVKNFIPNLKNTECSLLDRISINWAGYSEVEGEMALISAALRDNMDYLHFCQGADLPLKSADWIDHFFTLHRGTQFVGIDNNDSQKYIQQSIQCKFPLFDLPSYRSSQVLHYINHGIAYLQIPFIDKSKTGYRGAAQFSIDSNFASYLLKSKDEIKRRFRFSRCPVELFVCNMLMESNFRNNTSNGNSLRLINSRRVRASSPDYFTMADEDILIKAILSDKYVFARKFHDEKSKEIMRIIQMNLIKQSSE